MAESEGFEPSDPVTQIGSLANYWFQPLTHDSVTRGYSGGGAGLATRFAVPNVAPAAQRSGGQS